MRCKSGQDDTDISCHSQLMQLWFFFLLSCVKCWNYTGLLLYMGQKAHCINVYILIAPINKLHCMQTVLLRRVCFPENSGGFIVVLDVCAFQNMCTSPTSIPKILETLQRGGSSYSRAEEVSVATWNKAPAVFWVSWDRVVLFFELVTGDIFQGKDTNMQTALCNIGLVHWMFCSMTGFSHWSN